jgi:hypothetical protein
VEVEVEVGPTKEGEEESNWNVGDMEEGVVGTECDWEGEAGEVEKGDNPHPAPVPGPELEPNLLVKSGRRFCFPFVVAVVIVVEVEVDENADEENDLPCPPGWPTLKPSATCTHI